MRLSRSGFWRSFGPFCVQCILLPLCLLLRVSYAELCPDETLTVGSRSGTTAKRKTCPDFKDDINEKFCCPSHVLPGSYYCCTEESLLQLEAEETAELRRQFIKNYLALVIIASLGIVGLLTAITMCLCKRLSFCPLRANKSACSAVQATQRYRPVDTLPPKPTCYEAPPPYDSSFAQNSQRRNDWHCLLENEVNDSRQVGSGGPQ